jgi:23S rRNA pseudouridine2604 synthase
MEDEGIRLAKRVAELASCSRGEAERYIAGGWVSVDGVVAEEPATRVTPEQEVVLLPGATSAEPAPVTLLLHKPAGVNAGVGAQGQPALECLSADTQEGQERFLKRHLHKLTLATPLETSASGLVIYTQDFRVVRKLLQESARVEQEYVVEVAGQMRDGGLELLNQGLKFNGKPIEQMKVSWQNETRLRFAGKGIRPGQIEHMCRAVGEEVVAMKRLRVGRMPMASLPVGHWRYLTEFERF